MLGHGVAEIVSETSSQGCGTVMRTLGLILVAAMTTASVLRAGMPEEMTSFDHPKLVVQASNFQVDRQEPVRPLAELSSYCGECHANQSMLESGAGPALGPPGHSHPVEVRYPEDSEDYVGVELLDPRLTLIEGRLSCATCHDLTRLDHRLVVGEEGGMLCRACHRR
jgi:hypothetical protein